MNYSHGDDGYLYDREIIANFSTNTWYKGPSSELITHIQKEVANISQYPEVHAESLTKAIANYHQVDYENILINNGSTETIFLIAQAFRESNSRIVTPTFSEYEHACSLFKHNLTYCGSNFINANMITPEGLFWLCNPNNPTGQLLKKDLLKKIIKKNPQTTFIIDEAYSDYCLVNESLASEAGTLKNLIILKSLTKNYCIPGLRLGYMISSPQLKQRIATFRPPWSTNSLAIQAGLYLLQNPGIEMSELIQFHSLAISFQSEISVIDGYEAQASSTGFFIIKTPYKASDLKAKLIKDYGLLIRDASNFRGLSPNHIRVATLEREKNMLLVKALQKVTELNRTFDFSY